MDVKTIEISEIFSNPEKWNNANEDDRVCVDMTYGDIACIYDLSIKARRENAKSRKRMSRNEILNQARECVCGKREHDYGSPENNFQAIADLWSAYKDASFTAVDVAMMMSLLKIARIKNGGTMDSFIDLAGYAACGGEINDKRRIDR